MENLKNRLILGLYAITLLTFTSCYDDEDSTYYNEVTTNVTLSSDATLGDVLVDAKGKSLYFFSKDTKETSNCSGGCLDKWPVFYIENINVGSGLDSNDFGTITRADGSKQTTYKNWPLYSFANDTSSGDTKGDGVGGVWFIAKPDYAIMYANAQLVGNDGKNYLGDYTLGDASTSYFVNIAGRTMYTFKKDTKNKNNFTKSDFSNNAVWPIVEITLGEIPSTLNVTDFGTIDVFGKTQLTYKGWPLYYFGQDTKRGDNKGISVPNPGVWPIVNKNITVAP